MLKLVRQVKPLLVIDIHGVERNAETFVFHRADIHDQAESMLPSPACAHIGGQRVGHQQVVCFADIIIALQLYPVLKQAQVDADVLWFRWIPI